MVPGKSQAPFFYSTPILHFSTSSFSGSADGRYLSINGVHSSGSISSIDTYILR